MVSSLAAQLAQGASLNASLLASRSKNNSNATASYLFTSKEAGQHDLDSILALARNGVAQLTALDESIGQNAEQLFADSSRDYDRTIVRKEQVEQLDKDIATILRLISPYLLQPPAAKIIEWLIRRFRIHEFNQNEVLSCFLPYHETTAFSKIVSLIHIQPSSIWGFLQSFKVSASHLPRTVLATEMCKNTDLARFVVSILPTAMDNHAAHRSLVAFSAGVLAEYISRLPHIDEGVLAFLLPACVHMLAPFGDHGSKDVVYAGAILLASLSHRCVFTDLALLSLLGPVIKAHHVMGGTRALQTVVSILNSQAELSNLSKEVARALFKVPDIQSVLSESTAWAGSEKILLPTFSWLLNHPVLSQRQSIAEAVLNSQTCPPRVVQRCAVIILSRIVANSKNTALFESTPAEHSEEQTDSFDADVLSIVYQRHHNIFQMSVSEVRASLSKPKALGRLDQLVMTLSFGVNTLREGSESGSSMLLATTSTDAEVRAAGVRQILLSLQGSQVEDALLPAKTSILVRRMTDPTEDRAVLEALYETDPEVLLRVAFPPGATDAEHTIIIKNVSANLASTQVSRVTVRLHLTFFARYFGPYAISQRRGEVLRSMIELIFVPFLLFTKPKQITAGAAWDIFGSAVKDGLLPSEESDLLKGCYEIIQSKAQGEEKKEEGKLNLEDMVSLNRDLAARIAENISSSDHFAHYLNYLVEQINDTDSSTRLFALLITRASIKQLKGSHQVDTAHQVFAAITAKIRLNQLNGVIPEEETDISKVLNDQSVLRAVVQKPSSTSTLRRLEAAIMILLPTIPVPSVVVNWLSPQATDTVSSAPGSDHGGANYVKLVRDLYIYINSTRSLSLLSIHALRLLFTTVGDNTLLLFAGLWSTMPMGEGADVASNNAIRLAALHHARAFLSAQTKEDESNATGSPAKHLDFQAILPSLYIALQHSDEDIRKAAVGCISIIAQILSTPEAIKNSTIYAYDVVYGKNESIQYLDTPDFAKLISLLCERSNHFSIDPDYLAIFHQEVIQKAKGDGKKEANRKQRLFCYLLSHVVAWEHEAARVSLLQSLQHVQDPARLPVVFPLIQAIKPGAVPATAGVTFVKLLVTAFDKSAVALLLDSSMPYWNFFLEALEASFAEDAELPLSGAMLQQARRLSPYLPLPQKVALISSIVKAAGTTNFAKFDNIQYKQTLQEVLEGPEIIVAALGTFQPTLNDVAHRASKKAKLDTLAPSEADISLHVITSLVEALASKPLPGSLDLVHSLLDFLGRLCQTHVPARSDLDYLEQLLLSCLESAVANVQRSTTSPSLRVDVLVDLIRVSDNPQTFQQALLLVASMARLAPESVIHTIMPIFTFMGSNIFHRDDTYSFKVVQQTISSIVPVMVSHLKKGQAQGVGLYIESRDFLRVFTDASTHVPRHRRNKFFSHLVQTLGPEDFAAPVCFLLVDKVASRVVRQKDKELAATLSLPLGVVQHHGSRVQLNVLIETLRECDRLLGKLIKPAEPSEPAFLDTPAADVHHDNSFKRQIHALLIFVSRAWAEVTNPSAYAALPNAAEEIISRLLRLSSVTADPALSLQLEDLNTISKEALHKGLSIMPANYFVQAMPSLLSSEDLSIKRAALTLLGERVDHVSSKARNSLAPILVQIIESISTILDGYPDELGVPSLRTLKAIVLSSTASEDVALATLVPVIVKTGLDIALLPSALSALSSFTIKLGPRLIPHLRSIIALSVSSLRTDATHGGDALDVLSNLLSTLPSFWGSELGPTIVQCLNLKVIAGQSTSKRLDNFLNEIAKRIPANTLLRTLATLWDETIEPSIMAEFFVLYEHLLEAAPRTDVLESLRPTFRVFLDALDAPSKPNSMLHEDIGAIEAHCVTAFAALVTKLSEASFTPLFRRLQDWAWTSPSSHPDVATRRQITFCRIMKSLLDMFKGLMSPYMVSLLEPITDLLSRYSRNELQNASLWTSVIGMLGKSFSIDEDSPLWKDQQLAKLLPGLVQQISVYPTLSSSSPTGALPECLAKFTASFTREEYLKKVNLGILMHTRSEDASVRLHALRCAIQTWTDAGSLLLGFAPETITFIHECAEDENDEVAREARKLKRVMESHSGPITDDFT